jgi:hypothetical protein
MANSKKNSSGNHSSNLIADLIGRKVICVSDDFSNAPLMVRVAFSFPKAETKYTIRKVLDDAYLLNEITNPICTWPQYNNVVAEPAFFRWRFNLVEDPMAETEAETSRIESEIACVLYMLGIRFKRRFSMNELPSQEEVERFRKGAPSLLSQVKLLIADYNRLVHKRSSVQSSIYFL